MKNNFNRQYLYQDKYKKGLNDLGKFLQYDILGIIDYTRKVLSKVTEKKKYTKNDINVLFSSIKDHQTKKTKSDYFKLVRNIIFNKKDEAFSLNPFGILSKKDISNHSLLAEVIYQHLYINTEIFRIECDIISNLIFAKGNFSKRAKSIKAILEKKTRKILIENNQVDNIHNMQKRLNRTIRNLIYLGVIQTSKEKDEEIYNIHFYNPDWRLFLLLIIEEFKKRKITIQEIENSNVVKMFFLEKSKVIDYLDIASNSGVLFIENQSGLNQIDVLKENALEMVSDLI